MEKKKRFQYEEVLDNNVDDLWDILFPYMAEKEESEKKAERVEESKQSRYLKFLTM